MGGTPDRRLPARRRVFLRLVAAMLGGTGALLVLSSLDELPALPRINLPVVDPPATTPSGPAPKGSHAPRTRTTCRDVTSIDNNWDNDMLCTRPDGTQFHTSYDGARRAED